jgi:hypothetical protein
MEITWLRFSTLLFKIIMRNARIPKTTPIQGIYATPFVTMIHPPIVVPSVTPRFPKDVARLLANSSESGADEII